MTDDARPDDLPDPIHLMAGFTGVRQARQVIIAHLRRMACGHAPYTHFSDEHLMTRAVWLAAADMLAHAAPQRTRRR